MLNDAQLETLLKIITTVLVSEEMEHFVRMAYCFCAFRPKLKHYQNDDKQYMCGHIRFHRAVSMFDEATES